MGLLLLLLWGALHSSMLVAQGIKYGLPKANAAIPGTINVGRAEGPLADLTLHEVEILDEAGVRAIYVERLDLAWSLMDLPMRRIAVESLVLTNPEVYVRLRPDGGGVNLATAFVDITAPKKEKKPTPPLLKLLKGSADRITITGATVVVETPTGRPVDLQGLNLEAVWSMTRLQHDLQVRSLELDVLKPVPLAGVAVEGGVEFKSDLTLNLSDLSLSWLEAKLRLNGTLGQVNDLTPSLDVAIDHLDLVDVQQIAAKAPLEGTITGEIAVGGRLKEELRFSGELVAGDGAAIGLNDVRLRLPNETREVLECDADLGLVEVSPEYFVQGVSGLPADLTLDLDWTGKGTSLDTLAGRLVATGKPFEYQQLRIGPIAVDTTLDGPLITTRSLEVGIGGGAIHVAGTTDVRQQSFALDVDGTIANLGALRRISKGLVEGGSFTFDGFTRGTWGGDGPHPFSVYSSMNTSARSLRLARVAIASGDSSLEVEMDVVPGGVPLLRGTVHATAEGIATPDVEQVRDVTADIVLLGASAEYDVEATRAGGIAVDTTGLVDWGALPRVGIRGDSLSVAVGDLLIESEQPFAIALESGAVDVTDLLLDAVGASLAADASHDPRTGAIAADVVVRGLDLSRAEPLASVLAGRADDPFDHGLTGSVKELRLKLDRTLAEPTIVLTGSIRGVTALERPGQDVELEVRATDGRLHGFVEVRELLTLRVGEVPIAVSLDGNGPPVQVDHEGVWDVELTIDRNELSTIAELADVELPDRVEGGTYDGLFAFEGTTVAPTARARLRLSGLEVAERAVSASFGASLQDGALEVSGSRLKADGQTIVELTGGAGAPLGELLVARLGTMSRRHDRPIPFLNDLELGAELRKVDMSLVHVFVGALKPLTGALAGSVSVTGELDAPAMDANVQLRGGRAGKQELHPVQVKAKLKDGRLTSGFVVRPKRGGLLSVDASAPLPLRLQPMTPRQELLGQDGLDVVIQGEGFPMPVLLAFVPDVWESEGVLTVEGTITGSILDPVPEIGLNVSDGLVCYKRTGICYEQVTLRTQVDPGLVSLKEFSFDTVPQVVNPIDLARGGRARAAKERQGFTAAGTMLLDGLTPGAIALDLEFDRMWALYTKGLQAQLHSPEPIRIRGTLPALDIRGRVELQNVDVDLGRDSVASRDIQPLTLPKTLRVHREKTPYGPGERVVIVLEEAPEEAFMKRFLRESKLDVTVTLTNNIRVRLNAGIAALTGDTTEAGAVADMFGNIKPDLTLGGEVRIQLRDGAPYLQGQIATGRGSELTVLTKKFIVEPDSSLDFVGLLADTQLNITATRPSDYGDVQVVVSKRLASPQIDFRSEELEDQADIMSVLITGKPLSEVGTGEGGAAYAAIVQGLAGFLTDAFGKYVPVDSLDFELGDDLSSFSVEAGKAITPYIFFIARYNHGVEDDENRVEGQLEIKVSRRAYVEFRIGDRLEGAAELVGKVIF